MACSRRRLVAACGLALGLCACRGEADTVAASFGDYDRDGAMDVYVCGYVRWREDAAHDYVIVVDASQSMVGERRSRGIELDRLVTALLGDGR